MGVKVYILTSTRRKVNLTIDEGVEVTFILGGSEILLLVYNASSKCSICRFVKHMLHPTE